jgi:hypothetical protein
LAARPWIAGAVIFVACFAVITVRIPRAPGAAARAIGAASAGVGFALCAAVAALFAGAVSVQQPRLVTDVFPIVLLTLYGSVWIVAFAVKRRIWLAVVATGCLAAAIGCGLLMGRPEEWLVLAAGMVCLVAVPGGVLIHQSKG